MPLYINLGTHQSKTVEMELSGSSYGASANILLGDRKIGFMTREDMEQLVQFLVAKGAVDLNELKERADV